MRTDLRGLQRWMQGTLVKGEGLDAAERLILPSATLGSLERLNIYRAMYEARLVEALRVDYPGLATWLGEDVFTELAELYIEAHPSQSYTLNRLGDRLPEFLAEVEGLRREAFTQDLARLELLGTEVFDEREATAPAAPNLQGIPEEQWETLRFHTIPALRLGSFRYPVHRFLAAIRRGEHAPRIPVRPTRLAVFRRDFQVHHLVLQPAAAELLGALAAGASLGTAMERCPELSPAVIFRLFERWYSAGLFERIAVSA
jgi:hypothetical protein